jgi:hypothetical protein
LQRAYEIVGLDISLLKGFIGCIQHEFDPNAILLYLINDEFWIDPVGYLPKYVAQKVIRPISNLLAQGQILPVKCKLVNASGTMPNIGVKAWVKSSAVTFPKA